MKRFFFLTVLVYLSILHAVAINYNGTTLVMNEDFTRTECGTAFKNVLKEVSGLACSRTTPGYLWAHGDENTDEGKSILAIRPTGDLVYTVNISGDPGRDDWEDIATGMYNGKNLFLSVPLAIMIWFTRIVIISIILKSPQSPLEVPQ